MINQSIIPQKLQEFEYYKKKIPLYLQNSEGFQEHFRIWYDLLVDGVVKNSDILLNMLLIFDSNYLSYLNTIDEDIQSDGYVCDILDKLGSIFGVNRYFKVTYEEAGQPITEQLQLNNEEFLILIKAQIIKNYCEGTRQQIEEYYKSVGLQIYLQTDNTSEATANLYLTVGTGGSSYDYSENIRKMFLGGMLRIDSVGIKYQEAFIDVSRLLFWDIIDEDNNNGWGIDTDILMAYEERNFDIQTAGQRTMKWTHAFNSLMQYPFGWSENVMETQYYAHNMWLDIARVTGLMPFIALLVVTIKAVFIQFRLLKIQADPFVAVTTGLSACFFLSCFVEPVSITAPQAHFTLVCS